MIDNEDELLYGRRYRVKKSFRGTADTEFHEGEVVVFKGKRYIPYDDCNVYEFESEESALRKYMLEQDGSWQDVLEWRNPYTTPA